jgi:hypothetical protein
VRLVNRGSRESSLDRLTELAHPRIGRPPYRHAFAMLLVLVRLEDFIRIRKPSRAGIIAIAGCTWKTQRGAIRHSVGRKVAGERSLWRCCKPDTRPVAFMRQAVNYSTCEWSAFADLGAHLLRNQCDHSSAVIVTRSNRFRPSIRLGHSICREGGCAMVRTLATISESVRRCTASE